MSERWIWTLFLAVMLTLGACDGQGDDDDDSADDDDTGDDDDTAAICTEAKDAQCVDEILLELLTQDGSVSDGAVVSNADGDDWVTTVDATAGGMSQAANNPWVYIRFDDNGATRVDIDDETALESMEWHVAARRFLIRLNGGPSAASCVAAAEVSGAYADITSEPSGLTYAEESFYDESCVLQWDMYDMGPQQLLDWWWYNDCVATTMTPYIIRLDDGRLLKFVAEAYYGEGQDICNDNGMMGDLSANLTWRWQFLD